MARLAGFAKIPGMTVPQTEIIISKDGEELLRKTVPPGEYVIGRSAECELVVPTDLISRRHAKLTIQYYETFIEDMGSSNGTFVAGERISEYTRFYPGQSVTLGSVVVELRRTKTEDPAQTMSPHSEAVQRLVPTAFLREQKYSVGAVIAQGGMGAILDAQENTLRRKVAIKRMLNSTDSDQLARFIEEAQITAQLDHPNIVPVYELGVDAQEQVFYSMKLVRGITLHKVLGLLAQGVPATVQKYPLAALLGIFQKTCDALAFAHSKGVLHRDLKPENIMLGEYGEVLVMDWGLARAGGQNLGGPNRTLVRSARREDAAQMTMVGMVLGTPHYMAPEQARGETDRFDARTDIYALGAILYHILALELPVKGDDVGEVLRSVANGEVAPFTSTAKNLPAGKTFPHLPDGKIPPALAKITRCAMALNMADRYATVQELQTAVEEFQGGMATGSGNSAAKTPWLLYAIITTLAAALALVLAMPR